MMLHADAPVAEPPKPSSVGLLLLDSSLSVLYANREAVRILTYPDMPRTIRSLDQCVGKRIKSQLRLNGALSQLNSGKRRYLCRAFSLGSDSKDPRVTGTFQPSTAVLIERNDRLVLEMALITKQYRLTRRERETLELLMRDLTSKEIAAQMNISHNTVKTFLRLLMLKMGASTRSGIIGKILDSLLLSKLAAVPPADGTISWVIGRDRAGTEMRFPDPAVPISKGPVPAARRSARTAGR